MKSSTLLAILWPLLPYLSLAQCPADAGPNHTICRNAGVTIGPASADPSQFYSWDPGVGLSDPSSPNPTAAPTTTTTYTLTVAGSCGFYVAGSVTVTVAGNIFITAPNGTVVPGTYYTDIYFPYGSAPSVTLHSDVSADWYLYPSSYQLTGTTFTYTPSSGTSTIDNAIIVGTHDENMNSCVYTDIKDITTHPCQFTSDYPVPVVIKYFSGACAPAPTPPATIVQTTTMGAGTSYQWTISGSSNWSVGSFSSNQATLSHSGSGADAATLYTRASNPSYFGGDGQEYWMLWGVQYVPSGCTQIGADLVSRTPTSLLPDNAGTTVFPNPASSFVTITNAEAMKRIEVSGLGGGVIKSIELNGAKSSTLPIGELAPGLYIGKIITAENTVRFVKFMVVR